MAYLDPPRRRRRPLPAFLAGLAIAAGTVGVSAAVGAFFEDEDGPYAFMATQPLDGDEPVTWDPCTPILVEVDPAGAPGHWRELVQTALDHVSEPSGLEFRLGDAVDRRPEPQLRPTRVDNDSPYVLVTWAGPDEVPRLSGDTVGLGGSVADTRGPHDRRYWVEGRIALDRDAFRRMDKREQQAVVDHELGHVVGLAHVDDPSELMSRRNYTRQRFGPGDLAGLALLGDAPCATR